MANNYKNLKPKYNKSWIYVNIEIKTFTPFLLLPWSFSKIYYELLKIVAFSFQILKVKITEFEQLVAHIPHFITPMPSSGSHLGWGLGGSIVHNLTLMPYV